MTTLLVATLRGDALDWAVHQAEGLGTMFKPVRWSTKWEYGGQIIDKCNINISGPSHDRMATIHAAAVSHVAFGPNSLIAAMRCYVVSRLGEEIDVPEELVK